MFGVESSKKIGKLFVMGPSKTGRVHFRLEGRTGKSLYARLGGYDVIAAFVTDYISLIRADPNFARFSTSRGTDKKMRDLQLNIDYMCHLTASSHYYMGRDMKTTHAGLGITESAWKANMKYMANALDKHKIPQRERDEVLALVEGLRRHIVEKP